MNHLWRKSLTRVAQNPILFVIGVASIIRVLYFFVAVFFFGKGPPGGPGHDGYVEIAKSLTTGKGYCINGEPVFFRPPTYVLFLVPLVALPAMRFWIVGCQIVLGAATCGLITRIAMRFMIPWLAILSGLTMALCPWHVHFTLNGMPFILLSFLVAVLLQLWLCDHAQPDRVRALEMGLLWATAMLCHPSAILLGPSWVLDRLWLSIKRYCMQWGLVTIGLFATGAAVVVSPWAIRNRVASGQWIFVSNTGGLQFYFSDSKVGSSKGIWSFPGRGYPPQNDPRLESLPGGRVSLSKTEKAYKGVGVAEGQRMHKWMIHDLLRNPNKLPRRLFQNGWWFWFGDRPQFLIYHLAFKVPILLLAFVGVWKGLQGSQPVGPLVLSIFSFWAIHAAVMGYIPFAVYCLASLGPACVLAAIGVSWIVANIKNLFKCMDYNDGTKTNNCILDS